MLHSSLPRQKQGACQSEVPKQGFGAIGIKAFGSIPATGRPSNSRVDDVPKPVHLLPGKRAIKELLPDERATRSRLFQLRNLLKNLHL
ncbi:MAG: hypothetical protein R3F40_10805 [Candidatus Competibacteraceae bacterium]